MATLDDAVPVRLLPLLSPSAQAAVSEAVKGLLMTAAFWDDPQGAIAGATPAVAKDAGINLAGADINELVILVMSECAADSAVDLHQQLQALAETQQQKDATAHAVDALTAAEVQAKSIIGLQASLLASGAQSPPPPAVRAISSGQKLRATLLSRLSAPTQAIVHAMARGLLMGSQVWQDPSGAISQTTQTMLSKNPAVLSADGDVMELCFVVLMEATNDQDSDLMLIMAETKAQTAAKQALRTVIANVGRDVAANAAGQTDYSGIPRPPAGQR